MLHIAYAYAKVSGQLLDESNPDIYIDLSSHTPKHTFSGLYQYAFTHNWKASTSLYYVDKMTWNGSGDDVESYKRVDLKLLRAFRVYGGEVEIAGIIHNLMNDRYREFSNENIFQRYGYLQLKIDL